MENCDLKENPGCYPYICHRIKGTKLRTWSFISILLFLQCANLFLILLFNLRPLLHCSDLKDSLPFREGPEKCWEKGWEHHLDPFRGRHLNAFSFSVFALFFTMCTLKQELSTNVAFGFSTFELKSIIFPLVGLPQVGEKQRQRLIDLLEP